MARTGHVAALLLLACASPCAAAVFKGTANAKNGFVFLGKFCFGVDHSGKRSSCQDVGDDSSRRDVSTVVSITLTATSHRYDDLQVYLYDDEDDGWGQVWVGHKPINDCAARSMVYNGHSIDRQGHLPCDGVINVTAAQLASGWHFTRQIHQHYRPRTWYAVLGRVGCRPIADVSYSIHFQNDGKWREFGVNEQGLNILYPVFLVAYLAILGLQLQSRSMYRHGHHLPKLLTIVLATEAVSALLFTVHFLSFASNGVGTPVLRFFAELAQACSKLVFSALLILIGQGWTIIRAEVQHRSLIAWTMGAVFMSSFLLLLWGEYPASPQAEADAGFAAWLGRDAASTRYIYEETPGKLLLLLDAFVGAVFLASAWGTVRALARGAPSASDGRAEAAFLQVVGATFGTWLLAVPLFIVIFAAALDPCATLRPLLPAPLSIVAWCLSGARLGAAHAWARASRACGHHDAHMLTDSAPQPPPRACTALERPCTNSTPAALDTGG